MTAKPLVQFGSDRSLFYLVQLPTLFYSAINAGEYSMALVRIGKARELSGLSRKRLAMLFDAGELPGRRIGAHRYFSTEALAAYISGGAMATAPPALARHIFSMFTVSKGEHNTFCAFCKQKSA